MMTGMNRNGRKSLLKWRRRPEGGAPSPTTRYQVHNRRKRPAAPHPIPQRSGGRVPPSRASPNPRVFSWPCPAPPVSHPISRSSGGPVPPPQASPNHSEPLPLAFPLPAPQGSPSRCFVEHGGAAEAGAGLRLRQGYESLGGRVH